MARPSHAWLAVMAADGFELLVNDRLVRSIEGDDDLASPYRGGYAQRLFDLTPYLSAGTNVLGVYTAIETFPQRTGLVVQGAYVSASGETTTISSDASWRVAVRDETLSSRGGVLPEVSWAGQDYEDGHWSHAVEGPVPTETRTEPLAVPPELLSRSLGDEWIWTKEATAREGYFRLAVDTPSPPRDGWLRVASKGGYRLLVNGYLVASEENIVGYEHRRSWSLRLHPLGPLLRRGLNVLAIQASSSRAERGVLVDGFVEDGAGHRRWLVPASWRASPAPAAGWVGPRFDEAAWPAVVAVATVTPADRRTLVKQLGADLLPLPPRVGALITEALVIVAAVVGCALLWVGTAYAFAAIARLEPAAVAQSLAAAFLLPALGLAVVSLLRFDPRLSSALPRRWVVVLGAAALLLLELGVLLLVAVWRRWRRGHGPPAAGPHGHRWPAAAALALLLALTGLGFALRFKDITATTLSADEATVIRRTQGVLDRGYPSIIVDGRVRPTLTSELLYFFKAVTIGLLGPDSFGLRLHDVIFGGLTIPLLYWAGAVMHGFRAGLLAAAVYAVLPSAIAMTHYGRYPSQQSFFAVLALVLVYRAFSGGALKPRAYYGATFAFIATYLTWEGAAFYLPALMLGTVALVRPEFRWLRSPHAWAGVGLIAWLVLFQLSFRLVNQVEWPSYGSGAQDVVLGLAWTGPFYQPTFYLTHFFLIDGHHALAAAFLLGIPLWIGRSRRSRGLAFTGVTLLSALALMTNFLELHAWRYGFYLLPLLVLNASAGIVALLKSLGRLARRTPGLLTVVRSAGGALVAATLVLSTSFLVRLDRLPLAYSATPAALGRVYFPAVVEGTDYVRQYLEPGDAVVAMLPHVVESAGLPVDQFLQFELTRPLLLGHGPESPIHRITSTPTLLSAQELDEVVARSRRIWLLVVAGTPREGRIPRSIRSTMRVVYEDVKCAVFLAGGGATAESTGRSHGDDRGT